MLSTDGTCTLKFDVNNETRFPFLPSIVDIKAEVIINVKLVTKVILTHRKMCVTALLVKITKCKALFFDRRVFGVKKILKLKF